jgi:hypothetical protein
VAIHRVPYNIAAAQAHWVRRDLILWNVPGVGSYRYFLHADPNGALTLEPGAIRGGTEFELRFERGGPGDEVLRQFPHLAGFSTFRLAEADLARVPELLRSWPSAPRRERQADRREPADQARSTTCTTTARSA